MFTGIVQSIGEVRAVEAFGGEAGDRRLSIACPGISPERRDLGASVSVSGVCLSVAAEVADGLEADVSVETLALTTLGGLAAGSAVNLEPALRLDSGLGGHLVSGHVDGLGRLEAREDEARSTRMHFSFPADLAAYIATKGSICVDGVSLTVNDVARTRFRCQHHPSYSRSHDPGTIAVGEPGQPRGGPPGALPGSTPARSGRIGAE